MATTTHFAQANFKTAYLQRELPVDAKAASPLELHVGDVVSGTIGTDGVYTLAARTGTVEETVKSSVAVGDYIVAQSDMTMEYGHVPVENRDYRYDDKVSMGTSAKKVALFKINDLSDINITSRVVG